jgi:hypothetical protein
MEYAQYLEKRDRPFEHMRNRICFKQMCSECEAVDDLVVDCEHSVKLIHTFWQDSVSKFIDYLRQSRKKRG